MHYILLGCCRNKVHGSVQFVCLLLFFRGGALYNYWWRGIVFTVDDACPELDRIELYGASVIPGHIRFFQGESGYFLCTTREATFLEWTVGGDQLFTFVASDLRGSIQNGSFAIAFLIERDVNGDNSGTRTSVLVVTPDPSFTGPIDIICDSAVGNDVCTITADVVGKYSYYNNFIMCEGELTFVYYCSCTQC